MVFRLNGGGPIRRATIGLHPERKEEQSRRTPEVEKAVVIGRMPPVHRLQPDAGVQQAKVDRMGE